MDTSDGSDIILGGGGSDTIRGMGGNDIIDGDKWLNVRILVSPREGQGWSAFSVDSIADIQSRLFSGEIKPSQLQVIREIVDGGKAGDGRGLQNGLEGGTQGFGRKHPFCLFSS